MVLILHVKLPAQHCVETSLTDDEHSDSTVAVSAKTSNEGQGKECAKSKTNKPLKPPPVVWEDGLHVCVEWVLCAVVHAECIARVHHTSGVVVAEHGVRPVQVGRQHKLHHMSPSQVKLVASLDCLVLEVPALSRPQQGRQL